MKAHTPWIGAAAAVVVFLSAPPPAGAAGFQLQEQTASGLGLAYSGMSAAAQDAGTAFWNPATMPLLKGTHFAAAAHFVDTSFEFDSAGSTYDAFGDGGDAGDGSWVPALYAMTSLSPQLSVGLAVNAPFGLVTDWEHPWAGEFHAVKSEVETLNFNPSAAYLINERVMIGAGVSYQQLDATLTTGVTPEIPEALGKLEGDDWAFGWNVGALFLIDDATRIGVTYRSRIDYTIEGDLTFDHPALAPNNANVRADLELPETVSVGLSYEFAGGARVLADYTWTGWDSIQSLNVLEETTGAPITATVLEFDNSWRAGIGAEYPLTAQWLVRAGVAYDKSPVQDEFRTPKLPDEDRQWLAIGARYSPNARWAIDMGYAHLWVDEASSNLTPSGPVPGTLVGEYDSSSDIFGVQVSYAWQ